MKKVYIFLTAICLVALTGCIKEEAYELEQVSLQVSLDTRATTSQQQGDKIEDVMLWAFKCTLDANSHLPVDVDATASGWRYVANVNTYQELANIHVPLDVCAKEDEPATQSYVLFAVINTKAFNPYFNLGRNTNYETLTKSVFTKNGAFWNTYPETSTPEVMPVSNWATFTVNTRDVEDEKGNITSANTHNGKCYQLTLPVYRAVAKAQLSMRKTSDNFALKVWGAKIVSSASPNNSAAPTNGAMFTKQDYGTSQHTSKETEIAENPATGATAFGYPNQTDGLNWWVTPTYGNKTQEINLYNTTNEETKEISFTDKTITEYDNGKYQWVASTFLLENDKVAVVNSNYSEVTTDNGGYYMAITYQVDSNEEVTNYVAMPKVVRNHDYQVNATVDANGDWKLTLNVNKWDEKTETHNYLNEVSIPDGGQIKWTSLPSGVQPNNGVLTLGAAANQQATCTFFLNTPANGTWQAELVTVAGQEGAITFADGKTTASGAIAGSATPAVLTIKTTKDNSLQGGGVSQNKVVLRITATATVGGVKRTYKVNGLTGITGVDYYTIVQDL